MAASLFAEPFTSTQSVPGWLVGGILKIVTLSAAGGWLAVPAGVALALMRESPLIVVKAGAAALLQLYGGVPFRVLLMAMVTLAIYSLPPRFIPSPFLWLMALMAMPTTAHVAAAVRRGLASVPPAHYEEAAALGLKYTATMRLIALPQALLFAWPQCAQACVGLMRNTSVLGMLSLYSSTFFVGRAETEWHDLLAEPLVAPALFYLAAGVILSRRVRALERRLEADPRVHGVGPAAIYDAD